MAAGFAHRQNPNDPLLHAGPGPGAELMQRMAQQCDGFAAADVENAAMNMVINVLRQRCKTSGDAEDALDQLAANAKAVLLGQHYRPGRDGARVSGTFAFNQRIVIPKTEV